MITKNYEQVLRYRVERESVPAYNKLAKLPTISTEQRDFVVLHSNRAIEKYKELIAKAKARQEAKSKARQEKKRAKATNKHEQAKTGAKAEAKERG